MVQLLLAAIWQLIRNPGLVEARQIRLLIFLLFVLETSQYPSGLRLEEVTLFVRLDGEHPSSSHRISRLNLPHVNEIKNLIVNPGFALVVSSYLLSWCFLSCTGSHFGPCSCLPLRR